jgi:anti-sigma B factor antagonist
MLFEQVELPGNIVRVKLSGSLDLAGAGEIDQPLSTVAAKNDKVIIDFSQVSFLASIGIRQLVKAARAIGNRGGRFVVYNPTVDTQKVLRLTGLDIIIPIVADESAAIAECAR